jgi:lysozyme
MAQRNALTPVVVATAFSFLCVWEGVSYKAVHERIDPPGVITVCNGITNYDQPNLKAGDRFTPEQCKMLLSKALPKYDACIQQNVKVDLPPRRHVAMLSYIYNTGCGNFRKSSILRDLNAGRTKQACDDFLHSALTANGKFLQGLANRRHAERALCLRED